MGSGAPDPGLPRACDSGGLFQAARRQERRRRRRFARTLGFGAKRLRGAIVAIVGVAILIAALTVMARTADLGPPLTVRSEGWCTSHVATSPGGRRAGLVAQAPAPVWSGSIGAIRVIAAGAALSMLGNCVASVDVATGHVRWVQALQSGELTGAGLVADRKVVVTARYAASCVEPGFGPRCLQDIVGVTGLNPATGRPMWTLALPPSPPAQVPAAVSGSTVLVVQRDTSIEGVAASSGRRRWSDQPPSRCAHQTGPTSIIASGPVAVAEYQCAGHDVVHGIDATSGRVLWRLQGRKPPGAMPDTSDVVSTMSPAPEGDGVVVIGESSIGTIGAPLSGWEATGRPFSGTAGVVVLGLRTGRPLWGLTVPQPTTLEVAVGGGNVCIARRSGISCRNATSGAPAWQWTTPGALPHGVNAVPTLPPIVSSGGVLSWAVPTASASSTRTGSQQESPATAFALWSFEMSDGASVGKQLLAAAEGTRHRWPPDTPQVLAAGDGLVLVAPAHYGATVVEALRS